MGKKKHNKTKNKPGVSNTQSVPNSSNEVINTANDESKRIIQNSVHYMGILEKAYLKKCRTKCGKCDACVGFSNLKIEYEEKVNETLLSSAETDKMAEQFESQVKSQEENTDSKEPEQTLPGIVQDGNGKSASHQQKPRGSSMNDSINRATASSSHYPTMQQNGDHVIRSSPRPIFPANIHLKRTVIFTAVNPFHKIPDTPMILSRRERTTANRRARQQAVPSAPPLEDEDFDTAQLTLSNILKVKKL